MKYPEALLPKLPFGIIEDIHDVRNRYLIHHTDRKDITDEDGSLLLDVIVRRTDHLRDYSNNLLGDFEPNHCQFKINSQARDGYFIADWVVGEEIIVPKFSEEFEIDEERGWFFLKIRDFHNQEVKYEDDSGVVATCRVIHTPTNSNYWHFSIRWFHGDEDINTWGGKKKGTARRLLTAAKSRIKHKALFDEPVYSRVEEALYFKT